MNQDFKQTEKRGNSLAILVPRRTGVTANFAGVELQKYLFEITDTVINIRKGTPKDNFDGRLIIIGATSNPQVKKLLKDTSFNYESLGEEGFLIKTFKGNLIIAGGSERGSLYGVYTFLEKFLAVRWFYPDPKEEIVPKKDICYLDSILKSDVSILEKPDFEFRQRTFLEDQNFYTLYSYDIKMVPKWVDWMAKNKMNCVFFHLRDTQQFQQKEIRKIFSAVKKRGLKIGIGDCAYRYFIPPDRYSKNHPEWFPMLNEENVCEEIPPSISHPGRSRHGVDQKRLSQPNFCTSNPEALKTFIANVVDYVKRFPETDFLLIRPNDGGKWCECPKCHQLSIADRYLKVDNELAKALYKINPHLKVQHNPYAEHIRPPKYEVPTQNIEVVFEPWGRDYSHPFNYSGYEKKGAQSKREKNAGTQDLSEKLQSFLLKWLKICSENNKVYLHEKYVRQRLLGPHLLPLKIFFPDLSYFKKIGIRGLHLHVGMGGWWVKGLNLYALARLLWSVETDIGTLLDDYFERYYNEAKVPMRRFYMLMEKALPGLRYANTKENFSLWSNWPERPNRRYPQGLTEYNENALRTLDECKKCLELATKQTTNKQVLLRIERAKRCFHYIKNQRLLIQYQIVAADLLKEALDSNLGDSLKKIGKAMSFLKKAMKLEEKNKVFVSSHFDEGVFWDVGTEEKKWHFEW